jgi:hypothetical protein
MVFLYLQPSPRPPNATVIPVPPHMAHGSHAPGHAPGHAPAGPVLLNAEQLGKLKSELDVVNTNCKILSEMLTELTPGAEEAADKELRQVGRI